jgi:nicotinamide mononucleotide (NMN) deamidase PncC
MVCFGWAVRGESPKVATRHFAGNRETIRAAAVDAALAGLIDLVESG